MNLLREEGLYRSLRRLETSQAPRTVINGKEVIMLASNNYLGLSTKDDIKKEVIRTIKKYGTGVLGEKGTGNIEYYEQD